MMSILWRIEQRLLCDYSQGLELKSQEPMPRNDGSRSRLQALTALNHIAGLAANIPPARRCWVQVGEDRVPDVVGAHLLELFEWRTPLGGVALMHKDEGLPLCHRGTDFTEATGAHRRMDMLQGTRAERSVRWSGAQYGLGAKDPGACSPAKILIRHSQWAHHKHAARRARGGGGEASTHFLDLK